MASDVEVRRPEGWGSAKLPRSVGSSASAVAARRRPGERGAPELPNSESGVVPRVVIGDCATADRNPNRQPGHCETTALPHRPPLQQRCAGTHCLSLWTA